MVQQHEQVVIAIDIGGTNITAGLIDGEGRVLFRTQKSTEAFLGARHVLESTIGVARQLAGVAQVNSISVSRIGISTAGQVDSDTGTVTYATDTIPGWTGVNVKNRLERSIGLTAFVENDASAAAWGEKVFGVAQNSQNFVMITLGTGVGGAVFVRGRLLSGSTGLAGLVGHVSVNPDGIQCICGGRGCLEAYASGTGIAKAAREAIGAKSGGRLAEIASANLGDISAKDVFDAAKCGDPIATSIVMQAAKYLGTSIGGLVTLLNPELVVIGGGVSNAGRLLLNPTLKSVRSHCSPGAFAKANVSFSRFLDECGLIGAAAVAHTCGIPRI